MFHDPKKKPGEEKADTSTKNVKEPKVGLKGSGSTYSLLTLINPKVSSKKPVINTSLNEAKNVEEQNAEKMTKKVNPKFARKK